jgi:Phd_YefM.
MANEITANELKTKGITAIDDVTSNGYEAIITVRGKQKYVVMTMEEYNKLREYELTAAIIETENDIKNGKYKKGTVDNHMKRLENV